ncbi:hypothetical protein [Enterovibrio norvegicus]|uniref:Uncharacterized protein n=1 Tax=Enterovibrio norvegicus TaxID=188144 RepID=A0A2N7L8B4_9GAMM|nr:hypothetical protein [Enterovibrio norvegicus]PMN90303.1 hypothetical protein BCT23_20345 [Enterovibrio norvegicus]
MKELSVLPQLAAFFFFPFVMVTITAVWVYETAIDQPLYGKLKAKYSALKVKWAQKRHQSAWWSMSLNVHLCIYLPIIVSFGFAYLLSKHEESTNLTAFSIRWEQYLVLGENLCIGIFSGAFIYWFTTHYREFNTKKSAYFQYRILLSELCIPTSLEVSFYGEGMSEDTTETANPKVGRNLGGLARQYVQYLEGFDKLESDLERMEKKISSFKIIGRSIQHFDQEVKDAVIELEVLTDLLLPRFKRFHEERKYLKEPTHREKIEWFDCHENLYGWFHKDEEIKLAEESTDTQSAFMMVFSFYLLKEKLGTYTSARTKLHGLIAAQVIPLSFR